VPRSSRRTKGASPTIGRLGRHASPGNAVTVLTGPEAADVLRAGTLTPRRADELAEIGAAAIVLDDVAFAARAQEPLLGTSDLYVLRLPDAGLDADTFSALIAAFSEVLGPAERVVVRFDSGAAPPPESLGLTPHSRYVARHALPLPSGSSGIDVGRCATLEERAFVQSLLAVAITDGYREGGHELKRARVDEYVRDALSELVSGGMVEAAVARCEGQLVGHGTWRPHAVDDWTGEICFEIIDIFVLEPYRAKGVTPAILRMIAKDAAKASRRMVGHVVCTTDSSEVAVLERLLLSGWSEFYTLWTR
jgi:GNAT superfamily N-acetyltransferase